MNTAPPPFLYVGARIVFVLPAYNPAKPGCGFLSPQHCTGMVAEIEPQLLVDIFEAEGMTTRVVVRRFDVVGPFPFDKGVSLSDAYQRTMPEPTPTPLRPPLAFAPGAKLQVQLFEQDASPSVATVVALHHSIPNDSGAYYEVACTDKRWQTASSPFLKRIRTRGNYLIPPHCIIYGCNTLADNQTMPSIREQLRHGAWRELQFFRVGNVLKRPFSTHKDGNQTHNFAGLFSLTAAFDEQHNDLTLQPHFEPYDGDDAKRDAHLAKHPDATLPLWRFYCGFTESVSGNPMVEIPADESPDGKAHTEPRGHYFDTRNYAELDVFDGSLMLKPRYLRQGYPMPVPGDWVCGVVRKNKVGLCLQRWFVCSEPLKQLIEYVQQPDMTLANLKTSMLTNPVLQELRASLRALKEGDKEGVYNWVDAFNQKAKAVRTETTSRPINQDTYATILRLLVEDAYPDREAHAQIYAQLAQRCDCAPDRPVLDDIHDIDTFRILIYYKWWVKHRKPRRTTPIPSRFERFLFVRDFV